MKILFANCGYASGLTGRYSEYFLLLWRYVWVTRKSLTPIIDCILYEKPDVVAFVELNYNQYLYLRKVLRHYYPYSCEQDKYGRKIWRKFLPVQHVHLLFSKSPLQQEAGLQFGYGVKKSILKATIVHNGITILLVHLSLRKHIRERQIPELREILALHKLTVCVGDFNTFRGMREIESILEKDKLSSLNLQHKPTYPAFHPFKELDYALVSHDIHHCNFKILPETFSDHRGFVFEVTP